MVCEPGNSQSISSLTPDMVMNAVTTPAYWDDLIRATMLPYRTARVEEMREPPAVGPVCVRGSTSSPAVVVSAAPESSVQSAAVARESSARYSNGTAVRDSPSLLNLVPFTIRLAFVKVNFPDTHDGWGAQAPGALE